MRCGATLAAMNERLYTDLTGWYLLLDPTEDHHEEATVFAAALRSAVVGDCATLLELGAGAGNNAHFLRDSFACTLVDASPDMLALSAARLPDCAHLLGDMRTLRLDRLFDAVLIHDALSYLCASADLDATARTEAVHLRPGGAAVLSPDCVRESFVETCDLHAADDGDRALRTMEWAFDPDPSDSEFRTDYSFALRRGAKVEVVHDHHRCGLFSVAEWVACLQGAGLIVELRPRPLEGIEPPHGYWDQLLLARKPMESM